MFKFRNPFKKKSPFDMTSKEERELKEAAAIIFRELKKRDFKLGENWEVVCENKNE